MVSRSLCSSVVRCAREHRARNGYAATLRARRMREEITTSLIGPEPRSHSPAWLVRSLSFMLVFRLLILDRRFWIEGDQGASQSRINNPKSKISSLCLLDLVAQLGRPLVVLGLDGLGQLLAELGQVHLPLHRHPGSAAALGDLADVLRRPLVGALEQRREVLLENGVIIGTAEQPALAELGPGDAAPLARLAQVLLQARVGHHEVGQQLVD